LPILVFLSALFSSTLFVILENKFLEKCLQMAALYQKQTFTDFYFGEIFFAPKLKELFYK